MNIEKIFSLSAVKLKNTLRNELHKLGYDEGKLHNKKDFLYAEGDAPYMLVAHLDTVHKDLPSIICYSKDGNYMMSPQGIGGDDRCGVYIILELLTKLPFKPYVVFTMDEEIGGLGADAFIEYMCGYNAPDLKYIVEYDRKGNNDCVFYQCDNQPFVDFVEKYGFKRAYGTFSDISLIAPELGVAAVNLSSGYYNPHTEHEYVSMSDMNDIINKSLKMLCAETEGFQYIKAQYSQYSYLRKKETVKVSFVPEGTVCICPKFTNAVYVNAENEIAIDEFGNYYRYNHSYGDLSSMQYEEIVPVDEPMYDEAHALELTLFF